MAKILCNACECIHIGRKSRTHQKRNGEPLYNCKLDTVQIGKPFDPDCAIFDLTGDLYMCKEYKTKEK